MSRRILIVDDDTALSEVIRDKLVIEGFEVEILQFLAERANRTVHRDQLIQQVGGPISPGTQRLVDRAIARLREKIEPDTKRPRYLLSAYGEGYALHF